MKQVIILIILVVVGYFAYQHFFSAPQQETTTEDDVSIDSGSQLPPLPEDCERLAKTLEDAIYGSAIGRVSFAQRNRAYRKLQSCLQDADFSDSEINDTIAEIEERVKRDLE